MPFRSKAEAARGGEAERARIARNLSNHAGEVAALEPLFQREQRVFGRGGSNMDQAVAQVWRQASQTGPPAETDGGAILHPQHLPGVLTLARPL